MGKLVVGLVVGSVAGAYITLVRLRSRIGADMFEMIFSNEYPQMRAAAEAAADEAITQARAEHEAHSRRTEPDAPAHLRIVVRGTDNS